MHWSCCSGRGDVGACVVRVLTTSPTSWCQVACYHPEMIDEEAKRQAAADKKAAADAK